MHLSLVIVTLVIYLHLTSNWTWLICWGHDQPVIVSNTEQSNFVEKQIFFLTGANHNDFSPWILLSSWPVLFFSFSFFSFSPLLFHFHLLYLFPLPSFLTFFSISPFRWIYSIDSTHRLIYVLEFSLLHFTGVCRDSIHGLLTQTTRSTKSLQSCPAAI